MVWKRLLVMALLGTLVGGCASARITDTSRTAVEQLLLSTAVDRAVEQMDFSELAGKKVFLDSTYLEGYDKGYTIGAVTEKLNEQGALLVGKKEDAKVIAALRSGAVAIDRREGLIGIPAVTLPIPLAGPAETPEVALIKEISQQGVAKLAVHAYDVATGKHLLSVGPESAVCCYNHWWLLSIPFRTTDIPEKSRKK